MYRKMEMNPTGCKYRGIKKQGIQRMSLFKAELFANIKRFGILYKTIVRAILCHIF